jgi:hypothetical protein
VAYVINREALPKALKNSEWTKDPTFKAADAVLADPNLKVVYKTALEKGCAVVTTSAT